MGYTQHHAIIVSAFTEKHASAAHQKALEVFGKISDFVFQNNMVSPILISPVNNWFTFFVGPDGSKEGWNESDAGDELRNEFVNWLKETDSYCYWAEVMYHDESGNPAIIDFHNKSTEE